MAETLLQFDKEIFLYINQQGSPPWDGFWLFVTNKWSSLPVYLLLLILAIKTLGYKRTLILLISVALLITVTDQLANFFKYGVQRLRPCFDPEISPLTRLVRGYCGGRFGFYSAHASNSAGLAMFFSLILGGRYRFMGFLLFTWALFIGYSRIYLGVHYPLDVLFGIATGLMMGWLFARLHIFASLKYAQ